LALKDDFLYKELCVVLEQKDAKRSIETFAGKARYAEKT
jgi:hypothetical protein